MASSEIEFKRGDTFSYVALMPVTWPAGDWTGKCELDGKKDLTYPVEVTCEWIVYSPPDPDNPGQFLPDEDRLRVSLRAEAADTELWPIRALVGDLQMTRAPDVPGDPPYVVSSVDFIVNVIVDRTSP